MSWRLVVAWLVCVSPLGAQDGTYRVVAEQSQFDVHVGRAGLFKLLGHDHVISVGSFSGAVAWDGAEPEASSFVLNVDARSLSVSDEELSDDDRSEVQATMEAEALAVAEHEDIVFESASVEHQGNDGEGQRLEISGELSLRGVSRELEVPLVVTVNDGRLVARGSFELESKDWGVPQIAALGGSIKTKSKLELDFEIVAVRE